MKRILWGSLLLLLAACGTTKPDLSQATNTFNFTVDPAARSVELASTPAAGLTAQAEDGSRVLVPDTDLSLESFTFTFLPGNLLAIDAVFKNVSDQTFTNLTFSRASSSSNIVSSSEPGVVETLKPGESTGPLRFTVQHRGQPFTYAVEASATVGDTGGVECTDLVNIPDDVLRQGIRDALSKPKGDITCADIASLTELNIQGEGGDDGGEIPDQFIENLEGLQYAVNLTSLELNGHLTLEDISQLSSLTNLVNLGLRFNNISDISSLGTLVNLKTLDLANNRLQDIGPLSNLVNLSTLNLSLNHIVSISSLVANSGIGNGDDQIDLNRNCLNVTQGSQTLDDVDTIESRNPSVQNVILGTQNSGEVCGQQPPPPPPAEDCTDPVNIPDDTLRQSIRDALNKPEGDITCADMASLTELVSRIENEVDLEQIGNLEGIQFAKNLETLDFFVSCCEVVPDFFEPLSGLTNLTTLKIFNIRDFQELDFDDLDFSPLSSLSNLTVLSLPETQVSNIDFLSSLTNLTTLDLSDNVIDDYNPLSNLTALKKLDLSSDRLYLEFFGIEDIGFLSSLTGLTDLALSSNNISDLSPLSGLTNLVNLDLISNLVTDIGPLVMNEGIGDGDDRLVLVSNCLDTSSGSQALSDADTIESRNPNVQNVFVGDQRGEDEGCFRPPPPPAEDCSDPVNIPDDVLRQNLRDALNKPEGDITCVDLASLTKLQVTGVDSPSGDFNDYASNFEGLQYATNLTSLLLASEGFPAGRLDPIADLRNLTELGLFSDFNQAPDLSALSNLTNLTNFRLSTRPEGSDYNGPLELSDLSAFSSLTKLTELRFGDVAVSDISPLSNLTNLERLEISNSQGDGTLANIEPLAPLTKLIQLNLPSNQVRDLEPLSGLTNLALLDLTTNLVLDLTPLVQNAQLGDGTSVITLYQNCLAKNETVKSQARTDIATIESRNPAVENVFVDLENPDDYNPACDYR